MKRRSGESALRCNRIYVRLDTCGGAARRSARSSRTRCPDLRASTISCERRGRQSSMASPSTRCSRKTALNQVPAQERVAVRLDDQPMRGCLHRVPLLLRPQDARLPRLRRRQGLRHPDRGQGQRGGSARQGSREADLGAASGRARNQHRPIPARRGTVPADARHHRRAARTRARRSRS